MRHYQYARKERQFRFLSKKIQRTLSSPQEGSSSQIEILIKKLKRMARELKHVFTPAKFNKVVVSVAICLGISFTNQISAQSFGAPQTNPFGLSATNQLADPEFVDLDGDGDMDILVGDFTGALQYFENIGSASNPQFDVPQVNPFGLDSTNQLAFPEFVDLDGDGDMDLLVGEYSQEMQYFENTGSASSPQFAAPQANPFGLSATTFLASPAFIDMDGDGDMDLLVGDYIEGMQYFENTGTVSSPQFAAPQMNPFGLSMTSSGYVFPAFSDLDGDGDMDLLVGELSTIQYHENTGSASNPQFGAPQANPFGITITSTVLYLPDFSDLDGDGDIDLILGDGYGTMQYFENTPISSGINSVSQKFEFKLYPNPVKDVLTIVSEEKIKKVEITDLSGKTIRTISDNFDRIDLSGIANGNYIVICEQGTSKTTQKLVIIK